MSNCWDKKYMGIAQPIMADVHVLHIGFDLSISGRDWHSMNTENRIDEFRRKFGDAIEPALDEIEHQVKRYEQYRYGTKEEE